MKTKGKAHEALGLVFQRGDVPPRMIVNNSKEQLSKGSKGKCREADDFHLVTSEPYSPLWGHCLELEGAIRTHTALNIPIWAGWSGARNCYDWRDGHISNLCKFE